MHLGPRKPVSGGQMRCMPNCDLSPPAPCTPRPEVRATAIIPAAQNPQNPGRVANRRPPIRAWKLQVDPPRPERARIMSRTNARRLGHGSLMRPWALRHTLVGLMLRTNARRLGHGSLMRPWALRHTFVGLMLRTNARRLGHGTVELAKPDMSRPRSRTTSPMRVWETRVRTPGVATGAGGRKPALEVLERYSGGITVAEASSACREAGRSLLRLPSDGEDWRARVAPSRLCHTSDRKTSLDDEEACGERGRAGDWPRPAGAGRADPRGPTRRRPRPLRAATGPGAGHGPVDPGPAATRPRRRGVVAGGVRPPARR